MTGQNSEPMASWRVSCLDDRPLTLREDDHLNNYRFAHGLIDFISQAATPITIAIQGGWGSGKTSLINLLRQGLEDAEADKSLCVFINAWEHSLFQAQANRAAISVGILEGLIEEIGLVAESRLDIPPAVKTEALGLDSPLEKAKKTALNLGKLLLWTAAKQAANVNLAPGGQGFQEPALTGAKTLRGLKEALRKAAAIIRERTPYRRFVCFVDDLDRVRPETAIEILDALKNIFDLEGYVFVLAIDYEVVVKGLEGKFGPKTEANEREFRQYFDKIIQVPFTMPVGGYSERLKALIVKSLAPLGYGAFSSDMLENIKLAAYWATYGTPRGVKRIINTLSLLQCVQRAGAEEADDDSEDIPENGAAQEDLEAQFIVVALHINFPEICRCLMEKPDFTAWRFEERQKAWGLSAEVYEALKNDSAEAGLWSEEWRRVAWCLCRKHAWYRGRERAAAEILETLIQALRRSREAEGSGSEGTEALTAGDSDRLSYLMDAMRVVSVETGADGPAQPGEAGLAGQSQLRFWEAVSAGLLEKGLQTKTPRSGPYLDVGLGRAGCYLSNVIWLRRREISVRLALRSKRNAPIGRRLLAEREAIEKALGAALDWPEAADAKAMYIGLSRPFDLTAEGQFAESAAWMAEWIAKFKEVFEPLVKNG